MSEQKVVAMPSRRHYIPLDRFNAMVDSRKKYLPTATIEPMAAAPASDTHLEPCCPKPPYDQAACGSCTANAIAHYIKMLDGSDPSRLWIYTMELEKEWPGQPLADNGANAADGCLVINQLGVCPEADFPYVVDPTTHAVTTFGQYPSQQAITDAAAHKYPLFTDVTNGGPSRIQTIQSLINKDQPVLLAFLVYPSFESQAVATSGMMPMPSATDLAQGVIGGHEVLCVGYDAQNLHILNSWGPNWGLSGFFHMPIAYLTGSGASGQYVSQLLTMGPVPVAPAPTPTPTPGPTPTPTPTPGPTPAPAPVHVGPARAQVAALISQLQALDAELAQLPQ
jgi:hypothetical protein